MKVVSNFSIKPIYWMNMYAPLFLRAHTKREQFSFNSLLVSFLIAMCLLLEVKLGNLMHAFMH